MDPSNSTCCTAAPPVSMPAVRLKAQCMKTHMCLMCTQNLLSATQQVSMDASAWRDTCWASCLCIVVAHAESTFLLQADEPGSSLKRLHQQSTCLQRFRKGLKACLQLGAHFLLEQHVFSSLLPLSLHLPAQDIASC